MGLYDNASSVDEYERMCEGYDGSALYGLLGRHLDPGKTLLELGSGPCNDLSVLKQRYAVTASDTSDEFLRRGRSVHSDVRFTFADAKRLDIEGRFDCIYSNKVLHHLTIEELIVSFKRQKEVIADEGLFAHSFWIGDQEFERDGQYFLFHDRDFLLGLIADYFRVVEHLDYEEFEAGDSIFVIAQNGRPHDETVIL